MIHLDLTERALVSGVISLKRSARSFCVKAVAFSYLGLMCGSCMVVAFPRIAQFEFAKQNQCSVLPEGIYQYANSVREVMLFPTLPFERGGFGHTLIHAPIAEEMIYRLALQHILFKTAPVEFLGKDILNSKLATVARIVLAALAFSLIHAFRQAEVADVAYCSLTR